MQDGDSIRLRTRMPPPYLTWLSNLPNWTSEERAARLTVPSLNGVTTQAIRDRKKVAKTFLRQSKLAKAGKLGKGPQQKQTGADGDEGQSREKAAAKNRPAADAAGTEDVEEHVGDADRKAKRNCGKRKRGRGGQGATSGADR
jgi:hypothetical protein